MTQHPDLFAALAAPFDPAEVKVRVQNGRSLHYVTARTVMNRLDEIVGGENWWDDYVPLEHSVVCRLTIRMPDGSTLTKSDAGGYAGLADSGDDEKSGFSDAFKRAAVKFGIGRYLYRDGVPDFVRERHPSLERAAALAPVEANPGAPVPSAEANRPRAAEQTAPASSPNSAPTAAPAATNAPRSGRALFAWTKDQEQKFDYGLLKYLNNWAKRQEFPGRMVEWDADQVNRAFNEACRKLAAIQDHHTDSYADASVN
jgi:hypothetical protein